MDEEKWKRFCLPLGLALAVAAAVLAQTGCGAQNEEPVIAQRTERQEEDKTDQSTATGAEAERDGSAAQETSLAEQMEAPGRYEVALVGESMELRADAPVVVPDVSAAPVLLVEREMAYTEEDIANFKNVVGQEEGIIWGENEYSPEKNSGLNNCTSEDGAYYVSFSKGAGGETPLMWLNQRRLTHGSGDDFDAADLSGLELGAEEQKEIEEKMCGKAETILSRLGLADFRLVDCQWRSLSKLTDNRWVRDGRYGVKLRYCRTVNEIPEPAGGGAVWGSPSGRSQYVEFVYAQDGTLVELKDIDRGTRVKEREEEFLLPFSAVAQIFEQYSKINLESSQPPGLTAEDGDEGRTKIKALEEQNPVNSRTLVEVTEVRLEYRLSYETEMGNTTDRGRLEPVWNFYGDVAVLDRGREDTMAGVLQPEFARRQQRLLASIRATDGQVISD